MIVYRDATRADGAALCAMARACFTDTFAHLYAPADLACFLDSAFGPEGLAAQITDPTFAIRLACDGDAIAGFAKVGPNIFPGDFGANPVELHQLYILGPWQGRGVSAELMRWTLDTATARGATALTLSVYIDNHRAKAFYARYGFVDVGRYDFMVGNHRDEDRIMVLAL